MSEVASGPPLLLITRRSAALRFAGGAFVFPGGRVEPEDRAGAECSTGPEDPDHAARLAALRETLEETGVAPDAGPADLVPFARWRPPAFQAVPRRFDTRFYLARTGAPMPPTADGVETSTAFWASAADILRRCDAGEGHVIFPTRRLLERLARFGSFAEARAQAERLPRRLITPWIERDASGEWLCIPEDAGYPVCREALDRVIRG